MAENPCRVERVCQRCKKKEQEERHIWTPWEYETKNEQVRSCKRCNLFQRKRKITSQPSMPCEKGKGLMEIDTKKLNQIPSHTSADQIYSDVRTMVRDYTDDQLISFVNNSTPSQCYHKPSFFLAIYEEVCSRLNRK